MGRAFMVRMAWAAALVLVLASRDARGEEAVLLDEVVAIVGREAIVRSEVVAKAALSPEMAGAKTPAAIERVQRGVLENMIESALVISDAMRLRLDVSALEVAQAKERILRAKGITHEQLRAELVKRQVSPRDYDLAVIAELLEQKWLVLVVKPRVRTAVPLEPTPENETLFFRDLATERKRVLAELRKSIFVEVRW